MPSVGWAKTFRSRTRDQIQRWCISFRQAAKDQTSLRAIASRKRKVTSVNICLIMSTVLANKICLNQAQSREMDEVATDL